MIEPIPNRDYDDLDESYSKCWCEQDQDYVAEFPENYKQHHAQYIPKEKFSPLAACISVIMAAIVIAILIQVFG